MIRSVVLDDHTIGDGGPRGCRRRICSSTLPAFKDAFCHLKIGQDIVVRNIEANKAAVRSACQTIALLIGLDR